MPNVVDTTVSRNTFLGSDDPTNATKLKGYGAAVFRNGKRIFDYEWNEMQDLLANATKEANFDNWVDGFLYGDVFNDGGSHDSFKITYAAGVLTAAAGRIRLSGFSMDLYTAITNSTVPGLTGFALPAAGHLQYIYVDSYDREVEPNSSTRTRTPRPFQMETTRT